MFLPDVTDWEGNRWWPWRAVEDWEGALRALCRDEGISFQTIQPTVDTANAVFILDRRFVVKISPPWEAETLPVERELLEFLEQKPAIPAPRLLASGIFEDRIAWQYLIAEYLPGEGFDRVREGMDRGNLLAVARRMGEIIRDFADIDPGAFSTFSPPAGTWREFFARGKNKAIEALREDRRLPESLRGNLLDFLEANSVEELVDGPSVLHHADFEPEHVLLVETQGRWGISGLIDYADARVGLREFEWSAAYRRVLDGDSEAMRAFLAGYDPGYRDESFCLKCLVVYLTDGEPGLVGWLCYELERAGYPINTVQELQDRLFPPISWE